MKGIAVPNREFISGDKGARTDSGADGPRRGSMIGM
jgi:hypothetical protein